MLKEPGDSVVLVQSQDDFTVAPPGEVVVEFGGAAASDGNVVVDLAVDYDMDLLVFTV